MYPMMVFLHRKLPSSVARVMQLSCISTARACTWFRNKQGVGSFPSHTRFLVAHLSLISDKSTVWNSRFTLLRGLPCYPDLEPDMQISLHPAQSCARWQLAFVSFPLAGGEEYSPWCDFLAWNWRSSIPPYFLTKRGIKEPTPQVMRHQKTISCIRYGFHGFVKT